MTWNDQHRRGDVLRAVETAADQRRDGVLPTGVPGVAETFADEADLVGALLLRWHARLSARLERSLAADPMDLTQAVASAWAATARDRAGVRLVLDRAVAGPDSAAARVAQRAQELERGRLAVAAGLASAHGPRAVEAGRRVEELAREGLDLHALPVPAGPGTAAPETTEQTTPTPAPASDPPRQRHGAAPVHDGPSFVDRIRAVLAA